MKSSVNATRIEHIKWQRRRLQVIVDPAVKTRITGYYQSIRNPIETNMHVITHIRSLNALGVTQNHFEKCLRISSLPIKYLTNKDRLCEQSEPQSYPIVGQARHVEQGLIYKQISFLNVRRWKFGFE